MLEAQESTVAHGKIDGVLNQGGQWSHHMACASHIHAPPPDQSSGAPDWISAVRRHQIAYNLNGALTPCPATRFPNCRNDLIYGLILWELAQFNDPPKSPLQCGRCPQRDGPNPLEYPFAATVSMDTSPHRDQCHAWVGADSSGTECTTPLLC